MSNNYDIVPKHSIRTEPEPDYSQQQNVLIQKLCIYIYVFFFLREGGAGVGRCMSKGHQTIESKTYISSMKKVGESSCMTLLK